MVCLICFICNLENASSIAERDERNSLSRSPESSNVVIKSLIAYFLSQEGVKNTKTERTIKWQGGWRDIVYWKLLTETLKITVLDYCNVIVFNKFNVLFKLYLCTDTVISLYRGRFYARCAKNSSLYREYRYIEDRYMGFCPIHFTVTFAGT